LTTTDTAEQLTPSLCYHAEGPVWLGDAGLHWVDMMAGDVLNLAADGTVGRRHVGKIAAVVRPRVTGGVLIAGERGFVLDDGDGVLRELPELLGAGLRMNEGGCDPAGSFYCGSMAYSQTPGAGSMYLLDADGAVTTVFGDLTISNGLEWSPDGSLAYYVDTTTRRVDVFDWDAEHGLRYRRPLIVMPEGVGNPDGLTVDAEGSIWVAMYGGGAVRRYQADGILDGIVEVPATRVTACTFGGPGLDELFITTSRENLADGEEPLAGSVFHFRPGVDGRPVRPYAG
jgi:sugar lactone lactonase YvrE